MSISDMKTLHEELTQLLMDNGCAVTKPSIDALVKFIAIRDDNTIHKVIRDVEKTGQQLLRDEYFGTRIEGSDV